MMYAGEGQSSDLLSVLLQQQQQHSPRRSSGQGDEDGDEGTGDTTAEADASSDRAIPLADAMAGDDEGLSMPDTHPEALLAEARQLV